MTDLQTEDLNSILIRMRRRVRRRSRLLHKAEKRHNRFLQEMAVKLNALTEKDRTKD